MPKVLDQLVHSLLLKKAVGSFSFSSTKQNLASPNNKIFTQENEVQRVSTIHRYLEVHQHQK